MLSIQFSDNTHDGIKWISKSGPNIWRLFIIIYVFYYFSSSTICFKTHFKLNKICEPFVKLWIISNKSIWNVCQITHALIEFTKGQNISQILQVCCISKRFHFICIVCFYIICNRFRGSCWNLRLLLR